MTNNELIESIEMLLSCHEQMENSPLRISVENTLNRLIEELRHRAIGISGLGKATA